MVIDFHSHILPGIDDGSGSVEESLGMLKRSSEQGIREMLATPHFYAQHTTPERFLEKRSASLERLRAQMEHPETAPHIRLAAEVYYFDHMSHAEELKQLTIEGTNFILLEMPMCQWTDRMYHEMESIQEHLGLVPVIAHVDRYLGIFRDYGIPERLAELPVLVQANASFFLKRSTAAKAFRMLKNHQIHVLGSDCHNLADRAPNLGPAVAAIRRKLGEEAISHIRSAERSIFPESEVSL